MKKYGMALLCALALAWGARATSAGPAPLPAWEAPHMVGHLEDVGETIRRVAGSFFTASMLEGESNRDAVLGWLRELPVKSVQEQREETLVV